VQRISFCAEVFSRIYAVDRSREPNLEMMCKSRIMFSYMLHVLQGTTPRPIVENIALRFYSAVGNVVISCGPRAEEKKMFLAVAYM
jgi:hypothetical protein